MKVPYLTAAWQAGREAQPEASVVRDLDAEYGENEMEYVYSTGICGAFGIRNTRIPPIFRVFQRIPLEYIGSQGIGIRSGIRIRVR